MTTAPRTTAPRTTQGGGRRGAWRLLVAALVVGLVVTGQEPFAGVPAAVAQERPRTIMDMLFGAPAARERPRRSYEEAPRRIRRPKPNRPRAAKPGRSTKVRGNSARPVPAAPAPAVVEKMASAKTVLVVGDFMAGSLAGGLVEALAANPGVKVESAADGSSGLVRDDHLDWVSRIGPLIDEKKPAVVVIMLGSNDSQTMSLGNVPFAARSPEWVAEYGRRADAFAAAVQAKSVPLVWVGMPSFRFERMSKDMAFLNEIYRKASGTVGGDFVDVWDGFVDANGAFSYSGPDTAGQQAKLRNADGITMTPDGAEKLAFFAQKPIFRLLGPAALADATGPASSEGPAGAASAVRPANATSAPLVSFSDPALDGGDALLGGPTGIVASAEPSPRERLVVSGEPLATPEGRADSFNWSGKTEAVSPLRGTDDVISRGSVELRTLRDAAGIRPPGDMPSLADAIIADWEAQNAAESAAKPGAAPPASTPPTAGPAPAAPAGASPAAAPPDPGPAAEASPAAPPAPISASPFAEDQTPL